MRPGAILMAAGMFVTATAQAADVPAGAPQRGAKIFVHQMCHNCHGTLGQGGGVAGPRIAPDPFSWAAFAQQVRKPRQVMPPYSEKNLSDQDLADIYAYIISIKPGAAARDIPLLNNFQ